MERKKKYTTFGMYHSVQKKVKREKMCPLNNTFSCKLSTFFLIIILSNSYQIRMLGYLFHLILVLYRFVMVLLLDRAELQY